MGMLGGGTSLPSMMATERVGKGAFWVPGTKAGEGAEFFAGVAIGVTGAGSDAARWQESTPSGAMAKSARRNGAEAPEREAVERAQEERVGMVESNVEWGSDKSGDAEKPGAVL